MDEEIEEVPDEEDAKGRGGCWRENADGEDVGG